MNSANLSSQLARFSIIIINMPRLLFTAAGFLACTLGAQPAIEVVASTDATTMHFGDKVLWTYHHDPEEGKPYFHPLNTTNGDLLSELRPKDHPWHRALWFSWKYINGVNYWEENRETRQSDGFTRLLATKRSINESQQVTIEQQLDYAPAMDAPGLLRESRTLVVSPPDASGDYTIDWTSEFRAVENVELSRTPVLGEPNGKKYGGYAGLSIRLNKSLLGGTFLTSDGALDADGFQSVSSEWMIFNAKQGASILMMDQPESFRSPTKWYVAPVMPYFSPAVLFDAPHSMTAGEVLSLRYRIVVSAEAMSANETAAVLSDWIKTAPHR
jgi:hypothetical protein